MADRWYVVAELDEMGEPIGAAVEFYRDVADAHEYVRDVGAEDDDPPASLRVFELVPVTQ